jgi:hypothetical protein
MDPDVGKYVIAVKRGKSRQMSLARAFDLIRDIKGVRLVGDIGPFTVTFSADEQALVAVVNKISQWCHIESVIDHSLQCIN